MRLSDTNAIIPLFAAGFYTILLAVPFTRRGQRKQQTRWLLAYLAISIAWEFLVFLTPSIAPPSHIALIALISGTAALGVLTAVHAGWAEHRRWLILSGLAIIVTLIIDILFPDQTFRFSNDGRIRVAYSGLTAFYAWGLLSAYLLVRTWRDYKGTRLPWHANRLLFWSIALLVVFIGEALLFAISTELKISGHVIRYIGVIGLAYGATSHRIFDVRTSSQSILAFITVSTLTALPFLAAVLFIEWQTAGQPINTRLFLLGITVAICFLLYLPVRRAVERVTYQYMTADAVDTSQLVRSYSQAVYKTLDVQQLSLVIVSTVAKLLETQHGALMLVTEVGSGYEIEPIPALGSIPRQKVHFPEDSLLVAALKEYHQPLLQYEIDFNPDFADLGQAEREWLSRLGMDVFVPVTTGDELTGLIAIGPKTSGVPYHSDELALLQILADQTVIALQNARLYSELGAQNEKIQDLNVDLISQNERLEIMDKVKSDFITIASHELRTPLTQVKGYADILLAMNEEDSLTRDKTGELIRYITRAAQRLDTLIADMLDASQLDIAGIQLVPVEARLDVIVSMAVEPLRNAMDERRIHFSTSQLSEMPPFVGDVQRLVQAFRNIIGNAVKYTPDNGSVSVSATLIPGKDNIDYIETVVADTGIGIDRDFQESIFDKFFRTGDPQLHSTGSTKFKGAGPGLGLHIARGVIEAHGGRIWVESEGEDEQRLPGSRFYIVLPVRPLRMKTSIQSETAATANSSG